MFSLFPLRRTFWISTGFAVVALSAQVQAANKTWNNTTSDSLWNTTSANWTGATFASGTDTAIFGATGAGAITVDAGGITTVGMTINTGGTGYVFSGGTLTSSGQNNFNESAQFNDVFSTAGRSVVANGKTVTYTAGGSLANLNSSGAVGGTATYSFTGGAYTLTGVTAETNNATVNLNFSGSSTFNYSSNAIIGYAGPAALTYNSSGSSTTVGITVGRSGAGSVVQQQGTITMTGNSSIAGNANGTLDVQGGTLNAGTTVMAVNSGTTAASGLVSVSGGTLTVGTIQLNSQTGSTSTLQVTAGTLNVNSITLGATSPGTRVVSLSGGTIGTNTVTTATWVPNITLGGNVSIRAATATGTSAAITLSGVLSGTGGFTKIGAGTLTLSGANTFSGPITVSLGALATSGSGTLGTADISLASAVTLTLGNNASIGDAANVTFTNSTTAIVLNFTGADTLGTLYDSTTGQAVGPGTYTAAQLNTAFGVTNFTGTGSLTITAVPEPSVYGIAFGAAMFGFVAVRRRRLNS